jgi:hypothetical protein
MTPALLLTILVLALFSIGSEIAMRIRLTKLEVRSEKLSWWGMRGGDEVAATYKEVFPRSRLPFLRNLLFWIFLGCAGVGLALILWKRG